MGTIIEEMIGTTMARRIWDYIYLEQIVIQKRSKTSKLGLSNIKFSRSNFVMLMNLAYLSAFLIQF
jgi:hypothetical protein